MVKVAKTGWYLGEYRYVLADKYRLALPKRIRVEVEGYEVILSRGFEPCIAGFDRPHWQKIAEQQLSLQFNEQKGRQLRREIFSSAMILELDAQGRMVLPESLVAWAGLTDQIGKEVVVIGAGEHFEIWSSQKWKQISGS